MASRYDFAIIDKETGEIIVRIEPRDTIGVVEEYLQRLQRKGVGLFRTTNHVLDDARAALEQLIFELKAKVKPHED